jgi:SAM-dependent methyltransferase
VAEALPFVTGTFDHCVSLLVLQEIRDRARALDEARRVTRRGGIVAACQWDFGRGMALVAALREAVEAVAPEACRAATDGQPRAFASEAELRAAWEAAGLASVETARLAVTLSYGGFAELWRPLLGASTPMSALVASLPPAAREAVRRRLRGTMLGGRGDGPLVLEAEAFAVRGRVADEIPRRGGARRPRPAAAASPDMAQAPAKPLALAGAPRPGACGHLVVEGVAPICRARADQVG